MKTSTEIKTPSLFGHEFDELLSTCSPFMSPFLKVMVKKLCKGAENASAHRQKEIYDECLGCMAKGLEFNIASISKSIGPDLKSHVIRLHRITHELVEEASRK